MTSNGLDTQIKIASGDFAIIFSVTDLTIPALVAIRSSLLIPGFLGIPDVITITSDPEVFS